MMTFEVRHHVAEDGAVFLELAGLKEWIRRRLDIRDAARQDRDVDPGPLLARDLLTALEKVHDGR